MIPSGSRTFNLAGRRASLGLAACLGPGARMPRLCFYNQRLASRAPDVDITSRDLPPSARGVYPPAFDELSRAAALLDGTRAGFGPIDGCLVRCTWQELRRFLGAAAALSTVSLWHLLVSDWLEYSELYSFRTPDLGSPRARQ